MGAYNAHTLGAQAEQTAKLYLQKQGLRLLDHNYHCYCGEVDLIMRDKQQIAFIEVRYRQHTRYGSALESITLRKRKRIIKTALHYLQSKDWLYKVISRFDIIVVYPLNGTMQIQWYKNAFSANYNEPSFYE